MKSKVDLDIVKTEFLKGTRPVEIYKKLGISRAHLRRIRILLGIQLETIEYPIEDLPGEEWKLLLSLNNEYCVSNKGRIKSISRWMINPTDGKKQFWRSVLISQHFEKDEYLRVFLTLNGKRIQRRMQRLVAEAFISNPDHYPVVNHKNGIKTDNEVENLEWCTVAYNTLHAIEMGLYSGIAGENNPKCRLKQQQVDEIRASSLSRKELANKYNVSRPTIDKIKTFKTWIQ